MKKFTKHRTIVIKLALILAATGMAARGAGEGEAGPDHIKRVAVNQQQVQKLGIKVIKAEQGNVPRLIRAAGEVRMNANLVAYVASQVSGAATKINAEPGQQIDKGTVLADLDSPTLAAAKSDYLIAVEYTRLNQACFDREKRLFDQEISAEHEYHEAEQALNEARIKQRRNRHALLSFGLSSDEIEQLASEPEDRFSNYRLTAPIKGTVISRDLVQGEVVREGEPLFMIADLSHLWVELSVSQDAIPIIREGHAVTLRLPDGTEPDSRIDFINPVIDSETRSATVRALLDNREGRVRPGTFVEASIVIPSEEPAVVVPKDAVQLVFDHETIFVWNNGAFEQREVQTGVSDDTNIEILAGVDAGELVAAVNAFHLKAEVIKAAAGDIISGHGHAH